MARAKAKDCPNCGTELEPSHRYCISCGALALSSLSNTIPQFTRPDPTKKVMYALSRVLSMSIVTTNIGKFSQRLLFLDHIGSNLVTAHCRAAADTGAARFQFFATDGAGWLPAWNLEWNSYSGDFVAADLACKRIGHVVPGQISKKFAEVAARSGDSDELVVKGKYSVFQRSMNGILAQFPARSTRPRTWSGFPSSLRLEPGGSFSSAKPQLSAVLQSNVFKPEYGIHDLKSGLPDIDSRLVISALSCLIFGFLRVHENEAGGTTALSPEAV